MKLKNVKKYLLKQGKNIVSDAKANLAEHTDTGNLASKIVYRVDTTDEDNPKLVIEMPRYGDVLDKGVIGFISGPAGASKYKYKGTKVNRVYANGNVHANWKRISEWVERKGIQFPGISQKSTAFLINRKLKLYGSSPTKWLTKAKNKNHFGKRAKRTELAIAFKDDIKEYRLKMKK